MSFSRILVAIDRSSLTPEVFEQALDLAYKNKSSLVVIHCVTLTTGAGAAPLMDLGAGVYPLGDSTLQTIQPNYLQADIRDAKVWLDAYCQRAAKTGIPVESRCQIGDTGSQICEAAREFDADLIVLGRRGHKGLTEMLLGSVSNHVLHNAPCSVLIIQDRET